MRATENPIPILDLKAQHRTIQAEVQEALDRVLEAQQFILGPEVRAVEEEIARYCGTRYAVGVASGTDAILNGGPSRQGIERPDAHASFSRDSEMSHQPICVAFHDSLYATRTRLTDLSS